ncbi:MAG: class I SAM-dependent methyltransferase, partial [Desulfovibrionaceae bacterium]
MTRIDIINLLASYIRARDYLEIGVRYGRCLSCIKAPNRVGVDPAPVLHKVEPEYHAGLEGVGLYVCTSDKFFAKYAKTYDLVFVDGMHLYEFAMRDLLNSMNHLNPGGFVVMHDLCPRDAVTAARDRESTVWNGDVWKVALDVHRNHPGIGCFVVNDDHGVGVFWKRDEQD